MTYIKQGNIKLSIHNNISIREQNIIDSFISGNKSLLQKYIVNYIFNNKKNIIDKKQITSLMYSVFPKDKLNRIYSKHVNYLVSRINMTFGIDLVI